jgi:hypothetical protein
MALQLATEGFHVAQIVAQLESHGNSRDEVFAALQAVAEYFARLADFNPDVERGRAIAQLEALNLKAKKQNDVPAQLACLRERCKLMGLYQVEEKAGPQRGQAAPAKSVAEIWRALEA